MRRPKLMLRMRRGSPEAVLERQWASRCSHERRLIRSMTATTATLLGPRRAATWRKTDEVANPSRGWDQAERRREPLGSLRDS